MCLRPFGLYCSVCLGILFMSILCMCCSHFSWYCFISFTIFSAPVFSLIHWFFLMPYLNTANMQTHKTTFCCLLCMGMTCLVFHSEERSVCEHDGCSNRRLIKSHIDELHILIVLTIRSMKLLGRDMPEGR